MALKPIRRVVTGNDARGRSIVVWDGPAPGTHEAPSDVGRGYTNFWVWNESPPVLDGTTGHPCGPIWLIGGVPLTAPASWISLTPVKPTPLICAVVP